MEQSHFVALWTVLFSELNVGLDFTLLICFSRRCDLSMNLPKSQANLCSEMNVDASKATLSKVGK